MINRLDSTCARRSFSGRPASGPSQIRSIKMNDYEATATFHQIVAQIVKRLLEEQKKVEKEEKQQP